MDTQIDDESKHWYITMSVDHPHDTQLQGTYEEVLVGRQSTWTYRPLGLSDEPDSDTFLHSPPRKYRFYVQKGIAGELHTKDVQNGSFYHVSNKIVSQSIHYCAHMAAYRKTSDESGFTAWNQEHGNMMSKQPRELG
jgi:hypothetical protein